MRDVGIQLDEISAALDLLAHALSERDRSIAGARQVAELGVIGPAGLVHVAAGHRKPVAAGLDPRSLHLPRIDRAAQVDDRAARRMHVANRREPVPQRVQGVAGRAQRDRRIGQLDEFAPEGPLVRDAAVGEVDMGVDEARYQGAARAPR